MTAVSKVFTSFVGEVGVTLTRAQRVLAAVAFDGAEPRTFRGSLVRQLFGKVQRVRPSARGVVAVVAGARSGKSYIGALRVLHLSLVGNLDQLAPGERAAALIVAPDLRLARQGLRFILGALKVSPLAPMIVGETSDSVTLRRPDGRTVVVECLPATRAGSALRGRTLVAVLFDEACFFYGDDGYTVVDAELFAAVSPRVVRDGQILIFSTPWIPSGLLYELYEANKDSAKTAIAVLAPTALMRDFDPAVLAIIERERARDPRNAAREYDASFTDAAGTLLSSADVDAAVDRGVENRAPRLGQCSYAMTIDVGLRNDSTACTVFHVEGRAREGAPPTRTLVVDAVRELRPTLLRRVTLDEVEETIAALAMRYGVTSVSGDLHMADALSPRLLQRGLLFNELPMGTAAQEKRATSLVARFQSRTIRLPDHAALAKQCKSIRLTRHAGGRVSVGAPEGKKRHDDLFDTLLLATELAAKMPEEGGDMITRYAPIQWHAESHELSGGGALYFRRTPDGREIPCGPPVGSSAWIELRKQQKRDGLVVLGEPDVDAFLAGSSIDVLGND